MSRNQILWDYGPGGNVDHIAHRGLTPEDVEAVFDQPTGRRKSGKGGRPMVYGYTPDGRHLCVPYDRLPGGMIYPVTAFDAP